MRKTTPAGVTSGFIYSIIALHSIPDYAFTGPFAVCEGLYNAPDRMTLVHPICKTSTELQMLVY